MHTHRKDTAHTERPLAEAAGTRLAANFVLALCVAIGTVVVASQERRDSAKKAGEETTKKAGDETT